MCSVKNWSFLKNLDFLQKLDLSSLFLSPSQEADLSDKEKVLSFCRSSLVAESYHMSHQTAILLQSGWSFGEQKSLKQSKGLGDKDTQINRIGILSTDTEKRTALIKILFFGVFCFFNNNQQGPKSPKPRKTNSRKLFDKE